MSRVLIPNATEQAAAPYSEWRFLERFGEAVCELVVRRHMSKPNDEVIEAVTDVVNSIREVFGPAGHASVLGDSDRGRVVDSETQRSL